MLYSSVPTPKIYQQKPAFNKSILYKPKGWTDSVQSYINEARKLKTLILRNRRLMGEPYTWHVTINVETVQTPEQIADLWEKAKRSLRDSGIVAVWIREPTKSNKVHYHLILRNKISRKELEKVIKAAMPQKQPGQKRAGWHKSIKPVTDDWQLAHYVTKAKISGYVKGQWVPDYYMLKRLLFVTGLPFHKVGEIGKFWVKSKTKMWEDVKAVEKKIGEGLDKPNVKRLAAYVHDLIGGFIPLKDIERSFGLDADGPVVQQWIERLLDGEWAEEDAAEDG
jgi:tetrahydromethanopterin S-methyltransferase subunit F